MLGKAGLWKGIIDIKINYKNIKVIAVKARKFMSQGRD